MKLRWTKRAAADLIAIGDYIAVDDAGASRAWVEKLRRRAALAARTPRAGRVVPEVGRADVREVFVRTYRIVYRLVPGAIVVLTVVEGHRRLGALEADDG